MTPADLPAGLRLCRASGWNQTERDWQHFLAPPQRALVAIESGSVIGTVAAVPYGPFAWISMVLVDPASRGRGVGTWLLERGLALVPEGSTARLDATPAGEAVYRKLGFAGEYGLARLFLDGASDASRARGVRPLAPGDWPALLDMDAHAFGASRAGLLERLAAGAPDYAWVAERDGRLRGYLLGRHGHVREHLGPLIADSVEVARALVDGCLAGSPGRMVFMDVPDDQPRWRALLQRAGFAVERPFLRMYRGRLATSGQLGQVYAIAGPELG